MHKPLKNRTYLRKKKLISLAHKRSPTLKTACIRAGPGRCSSELAELAPLPNSHGRSTCCSTGFHDFLSLSVDVMLMSILIASFLKQVDCEILSLHNAFL